MLGWGNGTPGVMVRGYDEGRGTWGGDYLSFLRKEHVLFLFSLILKENVLFLFSLILKETIKFCVLKNMIVRDVARQRGSWFYLKRGDDGNLPLVVCKTNVSFYLEKAFYLIIIFGNSVSQNITSNGMSLCMPCAQCVYISNLSVQANLPDLVRVLDL